MRLFEFSVVHMGYRGGAWVWPMGYGGAWVWPMGYGGGGMGVAYGLRGGGGHGCGLCLFNLLAM